MSAVPRFAYHRFSDKKTHPLTFTTFCSLQRMDMRICPMATRAQVPFGLPKAPRIPCCRRSAPAHESILLMRSTWYGCTRTRRWKVSFPAFLVMYLLAAIRAASRASLPTFSFSKLRGAETRQASVTSWFFACNILARARGGSRLLSPPDKVNAVGERVHRVALHADIEDANLGVCGHRNGAKAQRLATSGEPIPEPSWLRKP